MAAIRKQQSVSQGKIKAPASLYDTRFRRLVGEEGWARLPEAVKRRFSKRLAGNALASYQGVICETRRSRIGWLLCQLCRVVGAPLPLYGDANVPAAVIVSEDRTSGGQSWTRMYGRERGFPQVIHSAKRFAGPTGLEEYLGRNLGMALRVEADESGLTFRSDHYFVCIFGKRIALPHWIGPGGTTVIHRDKGAGRFDFDLALNHPVWGELVHQHGEFHDA